MNVIRQAALSPVTVVMLLANAGVPSGLEVRASEPWQPTYMPDFDAPQLPELSGETFVRAFNTAHADYQASIQDSAIVIRPVGRHATYLDAPSTVGHIVVDGVMTAARKIFARLDPTVDAPGGVAGSYLGISPGEAGDTAAISLDGYRQTTVDLLNQVVTQSPRAWYVVISDDSGPARVLRCGFVHTRGSTTGMDLSRR
jgi:hypothetical protein